MRILGLDAAGHACAACVWEDGKVLAVAEEKMERGQDARLVPLVLEVMGKAGTDFPQLDRFAVTRGPGSFTGLRIGLAAARGFGLASEKPVIGVDRFSIYREQFINNPSPLEGAESLTPPRNRCAISTLPQGEGDFGQDLLVVLDSKRIELFCRLYPAEGAPHEAGMMTPEEIAALMRERAHLAICGDANDLLRPALPESAVYLDAAAPEVVTCAALAALADPQDPAFLPRPLYLRAPDVTLKKQ
ncbi:MAG: tRNA (adenosine(37)-N6)-threonylcarbamoyltransferase complex dimerization subunit type 1 TsaB [Alphaproteobacteria bacterium]|nr:tRNA (adenosine(37)-N6)-threonylcarbamoyltransferase complex dimerization subunit type 1 TsaB [Alphaproteobacteria bacterium]